MIMKHVQIMNTQAYWREVYVVGGGGGGGSVEA